MKTNCGMPQGADKPKTNMVCGTILSTIKSRLLIAEGDAVLVALSGGADSVCLLDALCKMSEALGIKVAAAHLNHMIRGAEADSDEEFARELCIRLNVPFYSEHANIPVLAKERGVSEELAGRDARYEYFARLCKEEGFNKTATAHNRNDRAETVLMRIMRGTGTDGLSSIKYLREDGVIRPLLDIKRDDIEEYCIENGLDYRTDSTNAETGYTRNKVRNLLIPMLEKEFNPNILETLCNIADNAAADAEFINGYAERLYHRINNPMPNRKPTVIDIESLKMVDEGIQRRLVRIAAKEVMGSLYKLEKQHTDRLIELICKNNGTAVDLPGGLEVSVKYGWLEFKNIKEEKHEEKEVYYPIKPGGELVGGVRLEVTNTILKPGLGRMVLDYDKVKDKTLSIRNRRRGDRMVFFKDGRTRKLKDYWIDKKVPREIRGRLMLLCADDEVVAIIGDRVAENYKPNKNSGKGLVVIYEQNYECR